MDRELWGRIEALFHRALAVTPAERAAWLATECGADTALRAEVERLLAADDRESGLVARMEAGGLVPREDVLIGRAIGPYRLTARIATGGMGVVYRAERTDGLFQREVAIKLLRMELATEDLVRRFEQERRTLAALHHPHIAQLLDGGTTDDGRPYLVMELVRGLPIDRRCDERRLPVDERLRLFVQVCRAVQFAHQGLVVHRDLKPGNVLVDEAGLPKLLDFGIARLLDEGGDAPAPGRTRTGARILTPDYAAPEQLTGGPVTTAIDVYALGVVLYELLTGRRPFPSEHRSEIEWHKSVVERSPTRPSSLVRSTAQAAAPGTAPAPDAAAIAAHRGATPRSLRRKLRGDLDRIVLMTLRKEPERRYASAKDLADDLERHLAGLPVQARSDSFAYRASKFVRRNRIAVGAGLLVLAALVFGLFSARRGEERAREQALHARIEAESFESTAEFLVGAFLTTTTAMDAALLEQGRRRILLRAEQVRREHAGEVHLRANLLDALGRVAERLGLFTDAEALLREACAARVAAFGQDSLEHALSLRSLGRLAFARGELAVAADLLAQALALHRAHAQEAHTDVASAANDLAACLRGLGRLGEAETLQREALELRSAGGHDALAVAESRNNLAGIELDRGRLPAAAELLEAALATRSAVLGPEDPLTLQSMLNLATTRWRMGEHERAAALLDEAERGSRALQVDGEEALAHVLQNRAAMRIAAGATDGVEAMLAETLALRTRRLGPGHPSVAATLTMLARVQESLQRPADARASLERALAIHRAARGGPRQLGRTLLEYGDLLARTGAIAEACAALREALALLEAAPETGTEELARVRAALERCDPVDDR